MKDWRQPLFSLILAVLLVVLLFTSIEAIAPRPQYDDFCTYEPYKFNISDEERALLDEQNRECSEQYSQATDIYNFNVFVISSIFGMVIVIVGLYVPIVTPFAVTAANGLLIAGLFSIFFGTISGWGALAAQLRPFIILLEIVVVTIVAWKKIGTGVKAKKK